jgi:hypothetical protein
MECRSAEKANLVRYLPKILPLEGVLIRGEKHASARFEQPSGIYGEVFQNEEYASQFVGRSCWRRPRNGVAA